MKKASRGRSAAQIAAQHKAAKASAAARSKRASTIKRLTEPLHQAKQMAPGTGRTAAQRDANIDAQIADIKSHFKGTKEYKARNPSKSSASSKSAPMSSHDAPGGKNKPAPAAKKTQGKKAKKGTGFKHEPGDPHSDPHYSHTTGRLGNPHTPYTNFYRK